MSQLELIRWYDLPSFEDERGVLTAIEAERDIPFVIRRIYYMHHIQSDRGGHGHLDTDELVIAAAGSFDMVLSDDREQRRYHLNDPTRGLFLPRMIFIELMNFSPDAVCLVLANTHYDVEPIRSYEEYLHHLQQWRRKEAQHD